MIHIKDDLTVSNTQDGLDIAVIYPTFYWYEILDIPTARISKAKKIANNILSDRPKNYNEIVLLKKDDKYHVYCFDKKMIETIIKKEGTKETQVYFLDHLAINKAVNLCYEMVALPFGDKLLLSPQNEDTKAVDLNEFIQNTTLPKPLFKIDIDNDRSKNWLVAAGILFVLFSGLYMYERYSVLQNITQLQSIQSEQNNDGKSGYEIDALIKGYEKTQKQKQALIEKLQTHLSDSNPITQLQYDGKNITVK